MQFTRMFAAMCWLYAAPSLAIELVPGHVYTASAQAVNQYDQTGTLLGSYGYTNEEPRGLAIGSDGNLYVVVQPDAIFALPWVDVIDRTGSFVRRYPFTGFIRGNGSSGKIAFNQGENQFYVAAMNGLYRFDVGSTGGRALNTIECYDVTILTSNNLMVVERYAVSQQTPEGIVISRFNTIDDPNHLLSIDSITLSDLRGIAYSLATDKLYITMWGGSTFPLLKISASSHILTGFEYYYYGDDIELMADGALLVGSWQQPPGQFTGNLDYLGQYAGPNASFVTHFPAPVFANGFD